LIEAFAEAPYPVPIAWRQECTDQAGIGEFQRPYHQLQLGGVSVECPVIFDLGGSAAPLQLRWY
jgi:hypothetical protein